MLGIDPGLVATGYAVLEADPRGAALLESGVVETEAGWPLPARLGCIHDAVHRLCEKHAPAALVLEDLYTEYRFPRTALLMAHARGVVCLAARQRAVTLVPVAPAEVKRLVAGHGAAAKEQVQEGVRRLLGLAERPRPSHVADALALALAGLSRLGGRLPEARR